MHVAHAIFFSSLCSIYVYIYILHVYMNAKTLIAHTLISLAPNYSQKEPIKS